MKGPGAKLYVTHNLFICFFPHFAYQKVQLYALDHQSLTTFCTNSNNTILTFNASNQDAVTLDPSMSAQG